MSIQETKSKASITAVDPNNGEDSSFAIAGFDDEVGKVDSSKTRLVIAYMEDGSIHYIGRSGSTVRHLLEAGTGLVEMAYSIGNDPTHPALEGN